MELLKLKASDKENSDKYIIKKENITIGEGYIFNREDNQIFVYIKPEFRSNGYGSLLFEKLLNIVKKGDIKILKFKIETQNVCGINIICKFGAVLLSASKDYTHYVLKVK